PEAAVEIAVDMVGEGMIDEATALQRVTSDQVRVLLRPRLKAGATEGAEVLAKGEGACQGIGVGTVVTDTDEAEARAERGEDVILARPTTSPEDVHGMIAAKAIVTEKGGSTSHAAVVSRALGLPCIVGCGEGRILALQGRDVTVDGGEGAVYAGALPVTVPRESDDPTLTKLIAWAQARSPIHIDRPGQSEPADIIDLDRTPGGEDPAQLPALLAGKTSAKGGALASDEGVRAAIGAGVKAIYIDPVLPALLAALHMDHPDPDKDTLATDAQG
ncbi:MAG: PEP-utilizing enzyme, partial [Pseudomonadota bacterium]